MRLGRAAFMRANDVGCRCSVADSIEAACNLATTAEVQEGSAAWSERREASWPR